MAVAAAAILLLAWAAAPATSVAGGKKVHACVVKRGPHKGAMRFAGAGKCHKGEKKLTWNKKGKPGKPGAAGTAGERGPQGPSGVTDDLLATIAAQQATIDALTSQLNGVTAQLAALTSQLNGLSPQVAALCGQMTAVTSQSNALRTVMSGIALTGLIPAGLGLDIPGLPGALAPFTCP